MYIHFFTRDKHPFGSKIIPPLLGTCVPKFILLGLLCLKIYGSFYMIHDNSIFCDLSSPWLFETTLLALVKMSLSQIRRVHLFESQSCLERILQFSSSLSSFHSWNVLRLLNLMIGFVYLQTTPKIFCNFKMDARLFFANWFFCEFKVDHQKSGQKF